MARRNQAKADALASVRARHRAATAKASRLRAKGVEIAGSELDPRRDLSRVKNYNMQQLQAYEAELNSFVRGSSFVAGAQGQALPSDRWRYYKSLERRVNNRFNQKQSRLDHIETPAGMTVGQRQEMMRSKFPTMHGPAANNPYAQVNRDASQIRSTKALNKFISQMESRLSDNYDYKTNRTARKHVREMLKDSGLESYQTRIDRLSASQFRVLWSFTKFAEDVSVNYDILRGKATKNTVDRYTETQIKNAGADVSEYLDWAEALPKTIGQQESSQAVRGGLRNNRRQGRKR